MGPSDKGALWKESQECMGNPQRLKKRDVRLIKNGIQRIISTMHQPEESAE